MYFGLKIFLAYVASMPRAKILFENCAKTALYKENLFFLYIADVMINEKGKRRHKALTL